MSLQFREPEDIHELASLFRLRYTVYSEDPQLSKMVSLHSNHDISSFDLNALHFGGFEGKQPVTYMRMVTSEETRFAGWVRGISNVNKIVLQSAVNIYFPFQLYCTDKEWSKKFIQQLNGRKIGEVGKLAIHKDYRKGGIVLNEFIQTFINYCKEGQKFDTGFGSCIVLLERYYRKFGFERAEGSVPFIYDGLPEAVIVKFDR